MSFNSKVIMFDAVVFIIGVIIIFILYLSIKRDNKKYNKDLVESDIKKKVVKYVDWIGKLIG